MTRIYRETDFPITPQTLMLQETLFHNANGYIGVRGTLEEGVPSTQDTMRGSYINGVYDIVPMKQAEKLCNLVEDKESMINVADTQTIRFSFDGEAFSLHQGRVVHIERILDMDAGVTKRIVHWCAPSGKEVRLSFCRMASFSRLSLFTVECEVTPLNFSGKLQVQSCHEAVVSNYANPNDPRLSAESGVYLQPVAHQLHTDESYLTVRTLTSGLTLCTGVWHEFSQPVQAQCSFDEEQYKACFEFVCDVSQGETLRLRKYTVFTDSLREADCTAAAKRTMNEVRGRLDALYAEQRQYLARFWYTAQMTVEGDEDANSAICFNLYQLLQAAGKDGHCSIAAKGLSGEGYEGHYFWDTEMYMMPFFIFTDPTLARQLLAYRYSILEAARKNARDLGHTCGALYPWRTIHGKECSGYYPSGSAQYHINGAVALAVVNYYLCTGDINFIEQMGAEILVETARLWLDTGHWYKNSFVLHDVTGPDEYTCMVNNNFYTNVCARYNMQWAVKIVEKLAQEGRCAALTKKLALSHEELARLTAAAAGIYLPYDEEKGINPQDDSFLSKPVWDLAATPKENFPLLLHYHPLHIYRYQVCKQADTILAYFVDPHCANAKTMSRSYAYYEAVTTHDSSLSTCVFSMVASQLGLRKKAWEYFGDSVKLDLMNTHGNTKDGVHTANMGGCYMAIVYGFGGLRVDENGLYISPYLPTGWRGYRFVVTYHGSLVQVEVSVGGCKLKLLEGAPVALWFMGQQALLQAELEQAFTEVVKL